jgi:WXG100 family type VII secretion target
MSGRIVIDYEEMRAAYAELNSLAEAIDGIEYRMNALNQKLQAAYEGQSAVAFDEFVYQVAKPNLNKVSDMCTQTANGIKNTLNEFDGADKTLSGTFTGR